MLLQAFRALGIQLAVGTGLLFTTWGLLLVSHDWQYALRYLEITVRDMKGPWVWTLGCGLMTFVGTAGRGMVQDLNAILDASPVTAQAVAELERSTLHRYAARFTVPITFLGVLLTFAYGVPHTGAARWIIFGLVVTIYYVAAYLLAHFWGVIRGFHVLYAGMSDVRFRRVFSPLHLENLMGYLAITTTLGVGAIYAGFRGTVTAGFTFRADVWRFFLTTPLVLFLPVTLFYNFYPRYTLRKVVQYRIFDVVNRLASAPEPDRSQALILDLRDAGTLNSQMLPFIDYRSLPSYLIAILFFLSLVYNHDPAVRTFLQGLLGPTANAP